MPKLALISLAILMDSLGGNDPETQMSGALWIYRTVQFVSGA